MMMEVQYQKIDNIDRKAQEESEFILRARDKYTKTMARIIGLSWKNKVLGGDEKGSSLDPLLAQKFRTFAGGSSIRLEKLLLELDGVESMGDPELRSRRKQVVQRLQELISEADALNKKSNQLIEFQKHLCIQTLSSSSEEKKQDDDEDSMSEYRDAQEEEDMESVKDEHEQDDDTLHDQVLSQAAEEEEEEEEDDEEEEEEEPMETQSRRQREPHAEIKKYARGYVLDIEDIGASNASVTVDAKQGFLNIRVPGYLPIRYALGPDVNLRQITKEAEGRDHLRIVLPKAQHFPMRTGQDFFGGRWASPSYHHQAPPQYRPRHDFWSRF